MYPGRASDPVISLILESETRSPPALGLNRDDAAGVRCGGHFGCGADREWVLSSGHPAQPLPEGALDVAKAGFESLETVKRRKSNLLPAINTNSAS